MESRDLALIRFVTRRQDELRGLHTAVFGLWMTGLMAVGYYAPPRSSGAKLVFWMVVLGVPTILHDLASRWYAARIGRVGPARPFFRPHVPWALFLCSGAIDLSGLTPVAGRSAFLLLLGAHSIWVAVRDRPFRTYHLGALALVALAPPLIDGPMTNAKDRILFLHYFLAGCWFLASGLADHCLLMTCIKRTAGRTDAAADVLSEANR